MTTLADEILAALPAMLAESPQGATVVLGARKLAARDTDVRAAMRYLDTAKLAVFMRYPSGRLMHLLPLDHDFGHRMFVCGHCRVLFERPRKSKRANCSRACAQKAAWANPDVAERRLEALRAVKATPEARAKQVEINRRRWSDPAQHERLSEMNRQRWADPAMRARLSAGIQAANGSPEARAKAAAVRTELWADPEYRAKCSVSMREVRATPEVRARLSAAMKRRWQDPIQREKFIAANGARLASLNAKITGKKQSPEQVRKRVEATRRTKEAKASAAASDLLDRRS